MRVYVNLTHTIAIDVDHDEYEATTDDELIEACRNDPDFAKGRITNGPHASYEVDWEIPYLLEYQKAFFDAERPYFEVLARPIERTA